MSKSAVKIEIEPAPLEKLHESMKQAAQSIRELENALVGLKVVIGRRDAEKEQAELLNEQKRTNELLDAQLKLLERVMSGSTFAVSVIPN